MKSKAIGLRIPALLWQQVSEYGYDRFPKTDNQDEKDFDITAALLELIGKGLGNDTVEQIDKQTVEQLVKDTVGQNVEYIDKQTVEQIVRDTVSQTVEQIDKQTVEQIVRDTVGQNVEHIDKQTVEQLVKDTVSQTVEHITNSLNLLKTAHEQLKNTLETDIKNKIDSKTNELILLFQAEFESFENRFEAIESLINSDTGIPVADFLTPVTIDVPTTIFEDTISNHSSENAQEDMENENQVIVDLSEVETGKNSNNDTEKKNGMKILSDRETKEKAIEFANSLGIEYQRIHKLADKTNAVEFAQQNGYLKSAFTRDLGDGPKDFALDHKIIRIDTGSSKNHDKYHFYGIS